MTEKKTEGTKMPWFSKTMWLAIITAITTGLSYVDGMQPWAEILKENSQHIILILGTTFAILRSVTNKGLTLKKE